MRAWPRSVFQSPPSTRKEKAERSGSRVVLQWMPPQFSDSFFKPGALEPGFGLLVFRTSHGPARLRFFKAIATFTKAHTKVRRSKAEVFSCFSLPDFVKLFAVGESLFNWSGSDTHRAAYCEFNDAAGGQRLWLSARSWLLQRDTSSTSLRKNDRDRAEATMPYMSLKFTTIYFAC